MKKDIFIVIPCYNEGIQLQQAILPLLENYTVVLVDDGSKTNVWDLVKELPITYLRHQLNLGQGAALQTGTEYAISQNAKIIVHFDADGQHQYTDIPHMIAPILNNEVEIVLGSRFLNKEHESQIPTTRRYVLKIAILVNFVFTGMWLTDAHNGFRAMSLKAAKAMEITENRMAHATEILQLIKDSKLKYKEAPTFIKYTEYSKQKGQSSLNAINILLDLVIKKII